MSTEFNFKNASLAKIPVSKVRENAEALRTNVDKETEQYAQLVDSVKKRGIINPVSVREIKDPATNETLYGLIDGLHRYNAAMDAGLTEIPALIGTIEEGDVLEAQIIGNAHKIETKPVQYTKALVRVLASNPLLTVGELAGRLSRSPNWLNERLGLMKLKPDIQKLVDDGTICLVNAYALAKLPEDKQNDLLNSAISKPPAEFGGLATNVLMEVRQARREGRKADTDRFMPSARLQRLPAIRDEQAIASAKPDESPLVRAAKSNGVNTVEAAIAYTLSWILHLDPVSVANDEAKWKADKQAQAQAAADRKAEKQAIKDKVAAEIASKSGQPEMAAAQ